MIMSIITIIILLAVLWHLVLNPMRQGYRQAGKDREAPTVYTDYEEIK